MRKLLFLLLLSGGLFAQIATIGTVPEASGWERIYSGTVSGASTTSSAWPIRSNSGRITLFFETDTLGASTLLANQSDSCLSVWIQISRYGWTGSAYDNDYAGTYDGVSSVSQTRVDTVARKFVNVTAAHFYMSLDKVLKDSTGLAWGDSLKVIMGIGVGDSLDVLLDIGGQ